MEKDIRNSKKNNTERSKSEIIFEIETNGTLRPLSDFEGAIKYNVSPKLKNSGEEAARRYKEKILTLLSYRNSIFKFVVTSFEDIEEMFN